MTRRRSGRRVLLVVGAVTLVLAAGLLSFAGWLGWFGGPLFKPVPATTAAPPAIAGTTAVFFSGDMGFNAGMGPPIAARIAAAGVPVIGVNSLTAYRHRRSEAETDALVAAAVRRALAIPGTRRVLLVGQSFGANALLEGTDGLPPDLRRQVVAIVLIVPGLHRSGRTTPGGVLDILPGLGSDAGPALPDALRLDWLPALCIHGATEQDSLCLEWQGPNVRRLALPGGHFLHYDAAAVARAVLGELYRVQRSFADTPAATDARNGTR